MLLPARFHQNCLAAFGLCEHKSVRIPMNSPDALIDTLSLLSLRSDGMEWNQGFSKNLETAIQA